MTQYLQDYFFNFQCRQRNDIRVAGKGYDADIYRQLQTKVGEVCGGSEGAAGEEIKKLFQLTRLKHRLLQGRATVGTGFL